VKNPVIVHGGGVYAGIVSTSGTFRTGLLALVSEFGTVFVKKNRLFVGII
jgi:hypothetical protein